jgi:hypothetical protein
MSHSDPLAGGVDGGDLILVTERGMLSREISLRAGLEAPERRLSTSELYLRRTNVASSNSLSASELDPSYGSRFQSEGIALFLPLFADVEEDDNEASEAASELLESASGGAARIVSILAVRFNLF